MTEALQLDVEPLGSTTLKRQLSGRGAEPDDCFYLGNAPRFRGGTHLDLERDPSPDIVVEVDTTNESLTKFGIYAALGVPEIWRYDGETVYFYHLSGSDYVATPTSLALPILTAARLAEHLEIGKTDGQTAARRAFRKSVRDQIIS